MVKDQKKKPMKSAQSNKTTHKNQKTAVKTAAHSQKNNAKRKPEPGKNQLKRASHGAIKKESPSLSYKEASSREELDIHKSAKAQDSKKLKKKTETASLNKKQEKPLVSAEKEIKKKLSLSKEEASVSLTKVTKLSLEVSVSKTEDETFLAKKSDKKLKKTNKKKEEFDLEDSILVDDEGLSVEEIPELEEFETLETESEIEIESEMIEMESSLNEDIHSLGSTSSSLDDVLNYTSKSLSGDKDNKEEEEIVLTDADGRRYCKVKDCDQVSSTDGHCRYHYLLLWKKIQVRRRILADGKLERYVEELTSRYPDKFLEMIWKDLKTEKDFLTAIAELEIDESNLDNEFEDETQTFIDEVRGVSDSGIGEEEEF